jgi:hypothetical protein
VPRAIAPSRLPDADRRQAVDRTNARDERALHAPPAERERWGTIHGDGRQARGRWTAIDHTAEPVEHAAEQRGARAHPKRLAGCLDGVVRAHAGELAERDDDRLAAVEAHDLRGQGLAAPMDHDDVADASARQRHSNRETRDRSYASDRPKRRSVGQALAQAVDVQAAHCRVAHPGSCPKPEGDATLAACRALASIRSPARS